MSNRDKVLERIRNLRMKGTDPASTASEAESCLGLAVKLMNEHMISEAELNRSVDEIQHFRFSFPDGLKMTDHVMCLIVSISENCGVAVAFSYERVGMVVTGRKFAVQVFDEMYKKIINDCIRVVNEVGDYFGGSPQDYLNGVCAAVGMKLDEMRKMTLDSRLPVSMAHEEARKKQEEVVQFEVKEVRQHNPTLGEILGMMYADQVEITKKV